MKKLFKLKQILSLVLALMFALGAASVFAVPEEDASPPGEDMEVVAEPPQSEEAAAVAAPLGTEELTYFYKLGAPVVFKGVFGAHDFYFTADKNWDVKSITLYLNISQSRLIYDGIRSTLTVYVNGEPFRSINLLDYLEGESTITLSVPLSKIKKGINSVKVQAYRRISAEPCADDVTHANWINIFATSGVFVSYYDRKPAMSIGEFPYPFYKVQESSALPLGITLADGADEDELSAAFEMASYIGKFAKERDAVFDTGYLSAMENVGEKNIIHIAKSGSLPPELAALIPAGAALDSGAVIKFAQSPYGAGRYILLVTAEKGEDLTRAVKFLGNEELTAQLSESGFFLSREVDVLTKDKPPSPTIKFSDLGYHGMYVYGLFEQNAELSILLPKNRILNDSASLSLKFRYSDNLHFENSLLSVYINGVPSGSKRLTSAGANNDSLTINIPPEARKGNYMHLRLSFDLELKDTWCRRYEHEMPWAYVVEDSAVYLPTTQALVNLFENFPNPFVIDNRWSTTMFVMKDVPDSADLRDAGLTAAMMGREITSNHISPAVSKGQNRRKDFPTHNLIVIGTGAEQSIIKENNDDLYFKYEPQWSYFLSNEKLELLPSYSANLVSFQLLDSPLNNKTAMLVLTSPDRGRLGKVIKEFMQPSTFGAFIGDASLINTADEVANYRFKKEVIIKPNFWTMDDKRNLRIFAIVGGFAALLIIITIILFRRKNRKVEIEEDEIEEENDNIE